MAWKGGVEKTFYFLLPLNKKNQIKSSQGKVKKEKFKKIKKRNGECLEVESTKKKGEKLTFRC